MRTTFATLLAAGAVASCASGLDDSPVHEIRPSADDILMGNPACAEAAARVAADFGDYELVVSPAAPGTYRLDELNEVTLASEDGIHLDWAASTSIDAVLVRGGDATAVYAGGFEAFLDVGLTAPWNPKLDEPYQLREVVFCYDHELAATTATSAWLTRTHAWSVGVHPLQESVVVPRGQTRKVSFAVKVARKAAVDGNWLVRGAIALFNPAPYAASVVSAEAWIGRAPAKLVCEARLPFTMKPEETVICRYDRELPGPYTGPVQAIVRTVGYEVGGASPVTAIDFADAVVAERDGRVEVRDQAGSLLGTATGNRSFIHHAVVGPFDTCGAVRPYTAAIGVTGADTGTTVWAHATIPVTVACPH